MWKWLLYGVPIGGLLVEGAYYLYVYVRKKMHDDYNKEEEEDCVADVVWINELTQTCAATHVLRRISIVPENEKNNKKNMCENPYCTRYNMDKIIAYIDSAKYSLDLAMYTLNSVQMMDAIKRALIRKVIVRIITDKTMAHSTNSQMRLLAQAGAPVRFPLSTALMHHKFCIIDGVNRARRVIEGSDKKKYKNSLKIRSLLMSGSTNWTMQGFNGNWENILITSDKRLIQKFETEFERMWKAFDVVKKEEVTL